MAKKKRQYQFSRKFKAKPTKEQWNELCPPMEYRVIDGARAYELGIVPHTMDDVNMVVLGASGSTANTIMYFANYMRVDKTELDQEPYFELFESGSESPIYHGMFHHASFPGRTEILSTMDLNRIAASGSSVDINFTCRPDKPEGTLDELREQGKIVGFEFTYGQGMKKKENDKGVKDNTKL